MLHARPAADVADMAARLDSPRLDSPDWQVVFMAKIGADASSVGVPRGGVSFRMRR